MPVFFGVLLCSLVSCASTGQCGWTAKVADYTQYSTATREEIRTYYTKDVLFKVYAWGPVTDTKKVKEVLLAGCGDIAERNSCEFFYIIDSFEYVVYGSTDDGGAVFTQWVVILISDTRNDKFGRSYSVKKFKK